MMPIVSLIKKVFSMYQYSNEYNKRIDKMPMHLSLNTFDISKYIINVDTNVMVAGRYLAIINIFNPETAEAVAPRIWSTGMGETPYK